MKASGCLAEGCSQQGQGDEESERPQGLQSEPMGRPKARFQGLKRALAPTPPTHFIFRPAPRANPPGCGANSPEHAGGQSGAAWSPPGSYCPVTEIDPWWHAAHQAQSGLRRI